MSHPGFVDLTGQVLGDFRVVARDGKNVKGEATWLVEHIVCGYRFVQRGPRLRERTPKRCRGCSQRARGSSELSPPPQHSGVLMQLSLRAQTSSLGAW